MINSVARDLHYAAHSYFKKAALQLASSKRSAAVTSLSYGAACCFHAQRLGHRRRSLRQLIDATVKEASREVNFLCAWLPKAIIHSQPADQAFNSITAQRVKASPGRRSAALFWSGYFHAEHWDNREALSIFQRLGEKRTEPAVQHWIGNLLAKLGSFEAAQPFLERAMALEPRRYNHYSHLGNVYRGLNRPREAERCYRQAIALINAGPAGRVEHIHLVRCYHGLSRLGFTEFEELERLQGQAAVSSGRVTAGELERIKF